MDRLPVSRKKSGRGLFQRANHSASPMGHAKVRMGHLAMPFMAPFSLVNTATLRLFNFLYYHRPGIRAAAASTFRASSFRWTAWLNWNRLYGHVGFYQYQCVIPEQAGPQATCAAAREDCTQCQGSFLACSSSSGG